MLFLLLFLLPSVVIHHVVFNCVLSRPAVSSPPPATLPVLSRRPCCFSSSWSLRSVFSLASFSSAGAGEEGELERAEGEEDELDLCRRRCCCLNSHFILSEFASECSFKHLYLFFGAGTGEGTTSHDCFKERRRCCRFCSSSLLDNTKQCTSTSWACKSCILPPFRLRSS